MMHFNLLGLHNANFPRCFQCAHILETRLAKQTSHFIVYLI